MTCLTGLVSTMALDASSGKFPSCCFVVTVPTAGQLLSRPQGSVYDGAWSEGSMTGPVLSFEEFADQESVRER